MPRIQDSDENTYNPAYSANFSYWPVVDDYAETPFIPLDPLEALMTGMFNRRGMFKISSLINVYVSGSPT